MSEESDKSFESEDSLSEEEEIEELEENQNCLNIMYYTSRDGSSCGYCKGSNGSYTYGK